MKKISQFTLTFLCIVLSSCQNNALNGKIFTGFEEYEYFHGANEHFQTNLTFKNDSVIVERNSVSMPTKDKSTFKKTGEIYRYKGAVEQNGNKLSFVAVEYKCSDCFPLVEVGENGEIKYVLDQKKYEGEITKNGAKLNGIEFKEN
jgi:hypothetical protein